MAASKKATKQNWLVTKCAVPLAKDRKHDFTTQTLVWKKDADGNPKKWHFSVLLGMSDVPIIQEDLKRDVLWTYGIPADTKKPSVISGIFCPAVFAMRDGHTTIQFTIDQISKDKPEVKIVKISCALTRHPFDGSYAPVPSFPFEDLSGLKKIEQKALSMVRVVGEALPPLTKGTKQKDWIYQITDYVRGDASDVKPLKAGREHQDSARSKEALNQLEKLLTPEEKKSGGRITGYRLEELAMFTQWSANTIRTQVNLIRKRKETK
mgnify:CR=1 FL=1|jgi:hypothetical protein